MVDAVAVLDSGKNKNETQAAIQDWLTENAATVGSIDHTDTFVIGSNKLGIIIWYTEAA